MLISIWSKAVDSSVLEGKLENMVLGRGGKVQDLSEGARSEAETWRRWEAPRLVVEGGWEREER